MEAMALGSVAKKFQMVSGTTRRLRAVPTCPVEDQDGMGTAGNIVGDLGQIGVHRWHDGAGQDAARRHRACRADGAAWPRCG